MYTKAKRVILYAAGGLVILLLVGLLVPALLLPRFVFHESLAIKIQVTDKASRNPISNAELWIRGRDADVTKALGLQGAMTDTNGMCEFQHGFRATGVLGRFGEFHISNRTLLVIKASG